MKQYEAVIQTMERLGGIATLGDLNREVFKIEDCTWNTKTPFASIRRIVQTTKCIYKIKPGLYGLESHRKQLEANGYMVETDKNRGSKAMDEFNHSYYQGILLIVGEIEGFDTYVPEQDKKQEVPTGGDDTERPENLATDTALQLRGNGKTSFHGRRDMVQQEQNAIVPL